MTESVNLREVPFSIALTTESLVGEAARQYMAVIESAWDSLMREDDWRSWYLQSGFRLRSQSELILVLDDGGPLRVRRSARGLNCKIGYAEVVEDGDRLLVLLRTILSRWAASQQSKEPAPAVE